MNQKNPLTKVLAVTGTALIALPVLTPVVLTLIFLALEGEFRFDFLMPMELFLFALVGSGLLLWAALRAHSHVKLVAWGIGTAILMFVGVTWFAEVTGLASGRAEPAGWLLGFAIVMIVLHSLGLIAAGTGGVLLLQELFRKRKAAI